jgi:nitrite reductase (NADH) small subunit
MSGGTRVRVARADEIPPGQIVLFEVGPREVGIVNHDGEFYAVQNVCPHALAPLCLGSIGGTWLPSERGTWDYGLDGLVLRCPRHGWEYDVRTGESVENADHRRVRTFPVEVLDGDVFVTL